MSLAMLLENDQDTTILEDAPAFPGLHTIVAGRNDDMDEDEAYFEGDDDLDDDDDAEDTFDEFDDDDDLDEDADLDDDDDDL